MRNITIASGWRQEEDDGMTRTFTATWTDSHGNRYEQKMELAPGRVTVDLEYHEQWVRLEHDVTSYNVTETISYPDGCTCKSPEDWITCPSEADHI